MLITDAAIPPFQSRPEGFPGPVGRPEGQREQDRRGSLGADPGRYFWPSLMCGPGLPW